MSYCMTEIEQSPLSLKIIEVLLNYKLLDTYTSVYKFLHCGRIPVADLIHILDYPLIILSILNQSTFHSFCKAVVELSLIESTQGIQIHIYKRRIVECTENIFDTTVIHTILSTHRAVNHRKQCGRNLKKVKTPVINAGNISGNITDYATTECYNNITSLKIKLNKFGKNHHSVILTLTLLTCR